MPYIEKVKGQYKSGIDVSPLALDGGLNLYGNIFNIAPNETQDCLNVKEEPEGTLTLFKYPKTLITIGMQVLALGVREGKQIHVLCYTPSKVEWRYADVTASTITWTTIKNDLPALSVNATFLDFQTDTAFYTVLATDLYVYAWDGTTVTELTGAPKTHRYCVDDYRLYALKDNLIHMTELGSFTWLSSTIPLTGARGPSRAIAACNDKVYCFTNQTCHILYGNSGNDYELSEIIDSGCIGQKAVMVKDREVYFLNINGLYKFKDGKSENLSKKINLKLNYYDGYSLASIQNDIYIKYYYKPSIVQSQSKRKLYIYKEDENKWFYAEIDSDSVVIPNMVKSYNDRLGERLFDAYSPSPYANASLRMITHNDTDTTTPWHYVTPMTFQGFNKQVISTIPVLYYLPTDSNMKLYYNIDSESESWTEIHTFTNTTTAKIVEINIPLNALNNVEFYNLKFSGTGDFKIYYIGIDGRVKQR
jgi:hypothetical protein